MAYTDTPLSPQRLKDSQPLIRSNFQDINTLINVDHYTFGSPTAGDHKKVTLPDQGVAPVFAGNDLGLFAQIPTFAPLTGVNELYVRKQNGTEIPMTASGQTQTGWTYLPSGILMKWGIINTIVGQTNVVFPVAANIPVFGATFTVITNPIGLLALMAVVTPLSLTNLQFEVTTYSDDGLPFAAQIYYLVIGR